MARFSLRRLLGPRLPVGLHVCEACGEDPLCPVGWDDADDPWWRVDLRCPACGFEHSQVVGPTHRMLLLRLERERMERWADVVTAALERDLIGPDDFRPPRCADPAGGRGRGRRHRRG
jgi:hypothetical protein